MVSARSHLVQTLVDICGEDAVVIGVEDNVDALGKLTVIVKQRGMAHLEQAPRGALRVEYVITVLAPAMDPNESEPILDDFVPSLLSELDDHNWFGWINATKVAQDQSLGYDVDCYVIAGPQGQEATKQGKG